LPDHKSWLVVQGKPGELVVWRPTFDPILRDDPHHFTKFVCPYNADAFESLLDKHNLFTLYPNLVYNLRHGFPLGAMPNLLATSILPNNASVAVYFEAVESYIQNEVAANRMSGPFTIDVVERILRGPVQSSPLIVSVQPQGPGEPDK
jgi:hypothetical protein